MAFGHYFSHYFLDFGWPVAYDTAMQTGHQRLKDWIARTNVTQRAAARLLDMDHTFLNQILSGRRVPGLANAVKIYRVTGIAVDAWLPTENGTSPELVVVGSRKRK